MAISSSNINNLFFRDNEPNCSYEYKFSVAETLNVQSLNMWTIVKTDKLFNANFSDWYLWYRFNVLHQWWIQNLNHATYYIIMKNIKKLRLQNFLNATEQNYLYSLKFNYFTKQRNLKSLITDFSLEYKEIAYFHYRYVNLEFDKIIINDLDLYITNKRMVVISKDNTISFYLDAITEYYFDSELFWFIYHHHKYTFNTNKAKVIKTSLIRLYNLLGKEFNYE